MENRMCSEAISESIIVYSKISLSRNFKKAFFINKLNVEQSRANIDRIYTIMKEKIENKLNVIKLWEEKEYTLKMYKEKKIISDKLINEKEKSGAIFDENQKRIILINEEDDLRIQCISKGLSLRQAYKLADITDDIIENEYSYEFHPKYGYVTSDLNKVGTGLIASVIVHLPAITEKKKIGNLINSFDEKGIRIEPVYKDESGAYGNLYEVSNKKTLGTSEENILLNLEKEVYNIIIEEKKLRDIMEIKHKYEIEDKIFRSYGILKNARIINSKEVLDLLSNIILGVDMSLIDIDKELLYKLISETRDSVIQDKYEGRLTQKEVEIERALVISNLI